MVARGGETLRPSPSPPCVPICMRPHMGFTQRYKKGTIRTVSVRFVSYLYSSPLPSCRSPRHLFPHITYCPEPRTAITLSDKNVSKGGEYIMPRGERILSPHRTPFAEGTGACSIPLYVRVSREGLCVPTCTLLCTRVYTLVYTCVHSSALTERPGGSLRGAPLPLREAKRRTIGGEESGRIIILRGSWYLRCGRARGDSA